MPSKRKKKKKPIEIHKRLIYYESDNNVCVVIPGSIHHNSSIKMH